MSHTRSLPYYRVVRQTGEGLAVTELGTVSGTPGLTLMLWSLLHVPPLTPCTTQPSPRLQMHTTTQPASSQGAAPGAAGCCRVEVYLVCDGCCPGNRIWMSHGSGRLACKQFEPVRTRKEKAMSSLPPRATWGGGGTTHTGT